MERILTRRPVVARTLTLVAALGLMLPSGVPDSIAKSDRQPDAPAAFSLGGTDRVEMGAVSRHADEGMSWSSSACRVGNSFTTGTLVVMAEGSTQSIESIEIGDEVLATDTETGSTAAREVEAVITGTGERTLVEIATTDGGAVVATDGHPIWEVRSQAWVDAVDLKPGDLLLDVDGDLVEVAGVTVSEKWATVHNLTVDVDHTFSVVVGNDAILTHNCPQGIGEQLQRTSRDTPVLGSGNAYSVAYETRLLQSSYPGVSRGRHFQEANENLLRAIDADPRFESMMDEIIPGIRDQISGVTVASRRPPTDWTWHHAAEPGVMQLVPTVQHTAPGVWQQLFHPGGIGGFSIWERP